VHKTGLDIHFIAIGGTGMAPLACLLKTDGHHVRGSDAPLYPPMSTLLEEAGIAPFVGFDAGNLEPRPDLVIVGNAVHRNNPEAEAVERLGLSRISMPEALARFVLGDRRPLVVAGTHGKTTTSSLAAWVWHDCGQEPGFLIGGIPKNLVTSFRHGTGERFVIEGDEYNAAYFDRGPKFLHYGAETLILTNVEFDHADLYPDAEAASAAFEKLLSSLPPSGLLVACGDSPGVRRIAHLAPCRTIFYGLGRHNDLRPLSPLRQDAEGLTMRVEDDEAGPVEIFLPMQGEHNASNALGVWAAARADGLPAEAVVSAMRRFAGVKRRAELLASPGGIAVIDDFAHHPTEVAATLEGLRARFRGRRLVAVFEPRSLTASQNIFFDEYRAVFLGADEVFLAPVYHADRFPPEKRLDLRGIGTSLEAAGIPAFVAGSVDELATEIPKRLHAGDVVVSMSPGSFDGLPRRLVEALEERVAAEQIATVKRAG
jgi:UDP-N-acetylmuramate: L-alanyl-gamma-D-glutamyl-meso-diaminopimelate ligase